MSWILAQRAQTRDVSGRFTRALELLGEDAATARVAGIYTLESLGRGGDVRLRGAVIEVLSAFVRRRALGNRLRTRRAHRRRRSGRADRAGTRSAGRCGN